jgi:hypothetical protein
MQDIDDMELKSELDEIMRTVEGIMKKVEPILSPKNETAEPIKE